MSASAFVLLLMGLGVVVVLTGISVNVNLLMYIGAVLFLLGFLGMIPADLFEWHKNQERRTELTLKYRAMVEEISWFKTFVESHPNAEIEEKGQRDVSFLERMFEGVNFNSEV